ncbi:MAG: alpha/beta fold hydrolase [Alphaproteobacteria bacterium]
MKIAFASFAAVAATLLSTASWAAGPRDVSIASVDGDHVAYRVLGNGQPAVVMISGLGDGMESFRDVAPEIAKFATVILYDRAGYGGSDRSSRLRDAEASDRELSAVLAQSGIRGPYVVVGHSLGGLFAEYFAAKHPDQVSDLILEESRPVDFTRRCEAVKAGMCLPPAFAVRFMAKGAQDEFAARAATTEEIESVGAAKGPRVLVISRAIQAKASAFDALWAQAQNDLAARYPGSRHLLVKSSHYIHQDQKEWFVSSVRAFLQRNGR